MQSFFQRLSSRWFATMTPAFAPASTIQERETMRKRRLLSVILLLIFLWVTACIPLVLFANAGRTQIGLDLGASSATLLALWLNRRGSLKRAGLLFLLVDSFVMAMSMINIAVVNPISIFLWPIMGISCAEITFSGVRGEHLRLLVHDDQDMFWLMYKEGGSG